MSSITLNYTKRMYNDTSLIPDSLISVVEKLIHTLHAEITTVHSSYLVKPLIISPQFTPINGLSGTNWVIDFGNIKWIARENSPQKIQLGINRTIEHKILRQLRFQNIAPHCVTLSRDWLILEWLPNNESSTYHRDNLPKKLGRLIQKIHSSPLSKYHITLKKRLNFLFNQIDKKRISYKWAKNHSLFNSAQPPSRSHIVLSHMDVHVENLICDNNLLKLIDWEYACDIEEHIALAAIIDSMSWSKTQAIDFLINYLKSNSILDSKNENQYQEMSNLLYEVIMTWIPWIHYLQFLWYEIRWNQTNDDSFIQISQNLRDKFI